jgi:hypothetical protein
LPINFSLALLWQSFDGIMENQWLTPDYLF